MFNFPYKKSDLNDFLQPSDFLENGEIGHYQRSGLLWSREACEYVRENANVKGAPNLTSGSFACG